MDPRRTAAMRFLGVLLSLVVGGIVLQVSGEDALHIGREAYEIATTKYGFQGILELAIPIWLTALAVALGFRIGLWNIGGEGQLYMGAFAAAAVGLHVSGPSAVVLPVMILAGAVVGGLWAAGPGVARAYGNVNEVITTLLLSFVAIQFVNYISIELWRDEGAGVLSATAPVQYELPLLPGSTVNIGLIAPFVIAAVLVVVFRVTPWGYEVTMAGRSPRAASYAGVPVRRRIVTVMFLSGAIAGTAGAILLAGTTHRLSGTISNQYGFSGFIVAALAAGSIVTLLIVGLLISGLLYAGIVLQTEGLSVYMVTALYGLILLVSGVAEVAARYRVVRVSRSPASGPGGAVPQQSAVDDGRHDRETHQMLADRTTSRDSTSSA